ncbi:MAG: hypothetical protein LHV69_04365 [Elusimicrobia bacterium]|nr:hypothetical protein [Candidatus Obscuribacterium magneticum]
MPFQIATAIIAGIFCTALGLWVYSRNPQANANRNFALFNCMLAVWNFNEAVVYIENHQWALFIFRLGYVGACFIPFSVLKFLLSIIKRDVAWPEKLIKWLSFAFAILSITPLVVRDIRYDYHQLTPLIERHGPFYSLFIFFFIAVLAYSLQALARSYRRSSDVTKNQLRYVAMAIFVGIVALVLFFLSQLNPAVPPIHYAIQFGISPIFAYAIVRHRLMDIGLFIRRVALFVAIYVALILEVLPLVVILHQKIVAQIPWGFISLEVGLISLVLSTGPFFYAYIIRRSSYFREFEMAGLTHELKSPLASIQGAADALRGLKEGDSLQPKHRDYIHMIDRNAQRVERAVNELITVFRLPTPPEFFALEKVNLTGLVREVVESYDEQAKEQGLKWRLRLPDDAVSVRIDPEKIKQVLTNLLSNAIKFAGAGEISVTLSEKDRGVRIDVADTGVGIPPDEMPYLFDRFFQGCAGRTKKGAGIGLTIAKMWVEAHGGEIHAESDGPGHGSRFSFTLPK